MNGKIIGSLAGVYVIYSEGVTYNVLPRGNLKFKKEHLCVGDDVLVDDDTLTIMAILPRKNELIRPKSSNIDQLIIVMSIEEPSLSELLLYKFLTYANMNKVPAKVVFTKDDLIKDNERLTLLRNDLNKLEIENFVISNVTKEGLDEFKKILEGKVSLFMGQTGVGKSSLLNSIDPSFDRKIGSYSIALGRGKHQTKEVILLPYGDGFLGDTPGFSSLDLNLFKEDFASFYPGYQKYKDGCYFNDCIHQKEKGCKVKEAIENGELPASSYEIYLKLLNELPYKKERYNL